MEEIFTICKQSAISGKSFRLITAAKKLKIEPDEASELLSKLVERRLIVRDIDLKDTYSRISSLIPRRKDNFQLTLSN